MSEFRNIAVLEKDWRTFQIWRAKYGYRNLYTFMSAIAKILKNFKPELEDMKK